MDDINYHLATNFLSIEDLKAYCSVSKALYNFCKQNKTSI